MRGRTGSGRAERLGGPGEGPPKQTEPSKELGRGVRQGSTPHSGADLAPPPPPAAVQLFGDRLGSARAYADILAGRGVERGLIGPREVPQLWDRHLVNCGVVAELVPQGARVWDVGSGAGLPGLVVALLRPDLHMTLLEPLLRRTVFLEECVRELRLANVTVLRGRTEEHASRAVADVVLARAVAPLERLVAWTLPLLHPGGLLLALKGATAAVELDAALPTLRRLGARSWDVRRVGQEVTETATTVVCIVAGTNLGPTGTRGRRKRRG
jgi:16S rRNA (guanine527-N7)-methyltransferase